MDDGIKNLRLIKSLAITCLALITINFIFDAIRSIRSRKESDDLNATSRQVSDDASQNAEALKKGFEAWAATSKKELEGSIGKAYSIISSMDDLHKRELADLQAIRDMIDRLDTLLKANEATFAANNNGKPQGMAEQKGKINLDQVMSTKIEEMEAREKLARENASWEDNTASEIISNKFSETEGQLLDEFEKHFGVELDPNERQLLMLKIGTYKSMYNAADMKYYSGLDQTVYERIEEDGIDAYTKPLEKLPIEEARKVFAMIGKGQVSIRLSKDDYPELYRVSKIAPYVPRLLMDEVKAFFDERSSK